MRILTNNFGFPEPLVKALEYDGYVKRGDISVTTLIDSPKSALLKNHTDYTEDVSDLVWSLRGSALHTILQQACQKIREFEIHHGLPGNRYAEEVQMEIDVNGTLLTGTCDLLYKLKPVTLYDYKDTSVWKIIDCQKDIDTETGHVIYRAGKEDCLDWQKQTNVYAWMLWKLHGIVVEKIRICVFLKDWNRLRSFIEQDYPTKPAVVVDIPVYNLEKVEQYVHNRIEVHKAAKELFVSGGLDAIPECTPEERWARPDEIKIYKNENASRALKRFKVDSPQIEQQAAAFHQAILVNNKDAVMKRIKGEDIRCAEYCPVRQSCHYFKNKKENK